MTGPTSLARAVEPAQAPSGGTESRLIRAALRRSRRAGERVANGALEVRRAVALRTQGWWARAALGRVREAWEREHAGESEPLVSVTIATWNRAELLLGTSLPSALSQSHARLEVVVVGDGCTDDTALRMRGIRDPRVRYIDLPRRTAYPAERRLRHMVAGAVPMNVALDEARGAWIAHLDDDDAWTPDHLATMLEFARRRNLEVVWARAVQEIEPGTWAVWGGGTLRDVYAPHSTLVMRSYLRSFRYDPESWRLGLGADWHMLLRMGFAGVRGACLDQVTVHAPLRPGTTRHLWQAEDREP